MKIDLPGGQLTASGIYTKTDGSTGVVGQFDFNSDPFYRKFTEKVEIPDSMKDFPDVAGSGLVRDLLEAVALDTQRYNASMEIVKNSDNPGDYKIEDYPTFEKIFKDLISAETQTDQISALDDLLFSWAKTSNYSPNAFSTNYIVKRVGIPAELRKDWFKMIYILGAFNTQFLYPSHMNNSEIHWHIRPPFKFSEVPR